MNEENESCEKDLIKVAVRENRAEELEKIYSAFLWEKVNTAERRRGNIRDLTFSRPHKIKNKDDLQYLQVAAENLFNDLDGLEGNKRAGSVALGLCLGIISVFVILYGIHLSVVINTVESIAWGCVVCFFGAALCVLAVVGAYRYNRAKREICEKIIEEKTGEILSILEEAATFVSEESEDERK